jgi:hypothetical protein
MKQNILKLCILSLLAIALQGLQGNVRAQETNNPSVEKAESRKSGVVPFHGKLKAVDGVARTITVGERTFQITSDTHISKAGQPATLEDGVVGEDAGGAYKKTADGRLDATVVRFGPKSESEKAGSRRSAHREE